MQKAEIGFPLVSNYFAAGEASDWDDHFCTAAVTLKNTVSDLRKVTEYYSQTPERKFGTCTSLERQHNRLRDSKREKRPRHGGNGLKAFAQGRASPSNRQARTASRAGQFRTGRWAAPLRRELEAQPRERVTPAPRAGTNRPRGGCRAKGSPGLRSRSPGRASPEKTASA